jgi:hypothetical protein
MMNKALISHLLSYHPRRETLERWKSGVPLENRPVAERLAPLFEMLRQLDTERSTLEQHGGSITNLECITSILDRSFVLLNASGIHRSCRLSDARKLRSIVGECSDYSVHLEIRTRHHGIPVYYCCRTRQDVFAEYALVVEDYYCSPLYPIDDERFVSLRLRGREEYSLRLSQFRASVHRMLGDSNPSVVDSCLYTAGRWVFSAAWHESQRPSRLVARCFNLDSFTRAGECLHLILTSDPCELRARVDDQLICFFDQVYAQDCIRTYLQMLSRMRGAELDGIWRKALGLYRELTAHYASFLETEVKWGSLNSEIPLWKIVYGNYARMDVIRRVLRTSRVLHRASKRLEQKASDIIRRLLSSLSIQ